MRNKSVDLEKISVSVAIVIVAIAVFVAGSDSGKTIAITQSPEVKTITTSGDANLKVAPDRAQISFGVETEALTASDSQAQNREISNKIMQTISSLGIPSNEVKTTQLTVQPITEYDPRTGKITNRGFRTTHIITVTTSNLDIVGQLVDGVISAGANRVNDILFSLSENTERNLRKQLLDDAAAEAKGKAEAIASGLGARIVGVRSASESSFIISPFFARSAVGAEGFDATQIATGEVDVSAAVSVSFEIN